MPSERPSIASQITFLYYRDLAPARRFYEQFLGLPLVEDQGWARIYRLGDGNAFIGIVDEAHGSLRAQPENAVMITLVVDDVAAWHARALAYAVPVRQAPGRAADIQIEYCFLTDPGGYVVEIQRFLNPDLAAVFGLQRSQAA